MKRTLALALALIMLVTMIPATMLSAFARGRGVYANTTENQSVNRADGQYIPETVVVDGVLDDTGWREDDWNRVSSENGTWNVQYPEKNLGFSYKYNIRKDYYYLYGALSVPTDSTGLVTVWLNDGTEVGEYTDVFTFDITGEALSDGVAAYEGNGKWTRKTAGGAVISDSSEYFYEQSKVVFKQDGENTVIEFKSLLADFCPEKNPTVKYFVSVDVKDSDESLFHPMIDIKEPDGYNRDSYFPALNKPDSWPSKYAGKIEADDIMGIGDDSFPSAVTIDGKFDEATWAMHTDFCSRWYERTNLPDYKDNTNFEKPYSDLTNNSLPYSDYYQTGAEHDVRVAEDYIYGASLVLNNGGDAISYVRFNLYDDLGNGTYNQVSIYLAGNGNTLTSGIATWYTGGAENAAAGTHWDLPSEATEDNNYVDRFDAGTVTVGANLYSFEFRIDRQFGKGFVPDYYDFSVATNGSGTGRYWGCANEIYGGLTETSDNTGGYVEHHPPYANSDEEIAALKRPYYPVHKFSNALGEFYKPYTTYTPDGYLGVKAWPGLTFSAGGPVSGDWISKSNSTRIDNVHYMHSLRADYEFVYGAFHVQVDEADFENWKHGTKDHAAGGDVFSLWVLNPYDTTYAHIIRYDVWTYIDENGKVQARIGGYNGRNNDDGSAAAYGDRDGYKAAFVDRSEEDGTYAFEYRIPLSAIGISLDISEDTTEQATDSDSTEIFKYFTSLSIVSKDTVGKGKDEAKYAAISWPKSGNYYTDSTTGTTYNVYPDGWGTPFAKTTIGTYNNFSASSTAMVLRYQDVIRSIEPDGRVVEEQRLDLDHIDYTNAEYREAPVYGQPIGGYEKFYVGSENVYLCARIDGDVSAYNTRFIFWVKNSANEIHKFEFFYDGANCKLAIDGITQSEDRTLYQYGVTSTNGATSFEAIVDIDTFGGRDGFEYFLEIQQKTEKEVLNRVSPKIELPEISNYASNINSVNAWYTNAGTVKDLIHFPREEITVDGDLNDNGWDNNEWIYVSTDINANMQETGLIKTLFKTDFWYQIRMDDENMYVAAVINYSDSLDPADGVTPLTPTKENIIAALPGFRIWIKTGTNDAEQYADRSSTYTHYYDVRLDKDGEVQLRSDVNLLPTYANNTHPLYNKYYVPVTPAKDENGKYITDANGKYVYTSATSTTDPVVETIRTLVDGETDLYGYTKYIIDESEANMNADESHVLKGELINPEDYESNDMLAGKREGVEAGVMRFGNDAGYLNTFNNGRPQTLTESSTVVEFKVRLDEFNGHEEFQYIVTSSCGTDWGGSRTTMYPAITSEVDSTDSYFHYYYPYWHWVDNTSITMTESLRADCTLLTYKRPVITLGAKVSKTYMYQGKEVNALRMGGLWEEKYIRKVKELAATANNKEGYVASTGNYTDYWDVKEMGMIVLPTYLVGENKKTDVEHQGKYDLFRDSARIQWRDADGIVRWAGNDEVNYPNSNYADYKNFAFYVTLVKIPTDMNMCFRGFVNYYDTPNGAPSYYDVIFERSIDMVIDAAKRTDDDDRGEEDVELPGGDFSRDDESGFTGTDGSDYETSRDESDESDESDVSTEDGFIVEEKGVALDIAFPSSYYEGNKSLVYADSNGLGYSISGFNTAYDSSDQNYFRQLYLVRDADGHFEVMNISEPNDTSYLGWSIVKDVMVVSVHSNHPNYSTFASYKIGDHLKLSGTHDFDYIASTGTDVEISATLNKVTACNHSAGFTEATCTEAPKCNACGKEVGAPLGHDYPIGAKPTCTEPVECSRCGHVRDVALGHTASGYKYDSEKHWKECERVTDGVVCGATFDTAPHSFVDGKCECGYECAHNLVKVDAKAPTCTEDGNIEYFRCSACGCLYDDANGTNKLTAEDVVDEATGHEYNNDGVNCDHCGKTKNNPIHVDRTYVTEYYLETGVTLEDGTVVKFGDEVIIFADNNTTVDGVIQSYQVAGFTQKADGTYFPWYEVDETTGAVTNDFDGWCLILLDNVGGDNWKIVSVDPNGTKYGDGTDTVAGGKWRVGGTAGVDENNNAVPRVAIAIPPSLLTEDMYEYAKALEAGTILEWTGTTDLATAGGATVNNGVDITFKVPCAHEKKNAATCEKPETCVACGEVTAPALGHSYTNYVSDGNAACGVDGTKTATCDNNCGTKSTIADEGSALEHVFNYVSDGNAACDVDGTKSAYCANGCGTKSTIPDEGSALEHVEGEPVYNNDATCKADGTYTISCTLCGQSRSVTAVGTQLSHSFTKFYNDNNATCTGDATETATCDHGCGTKQTNTLTGTALGHEFGAGWTMNDEGHFHKCVRCSEISAEGVIAHNFELQADGVNEKCTECGYEKDHVHFFGEVVAQIDPTCTANGQKAYYVCSSCGNWFNGNDASAEGFAEYEGKSMDQDIILAALGHSFTNYVSDGNAKCETDGTKTAKCDRCDKTDTVKDIGSKTGHSFTVYSSDKNATCTGDGTETAFCDNGCGKSDNRVDEGSAHGHSFTDYVSNNDAKCGVDGTKTADCDYNCGETKTITDEGTALDHSFTDYKSNGDANCTANGTETATCDRGCGETHTREDDDSALGHSFTNYVSNNDAKCGVDGTKTAKCDRCDVTETITDEGSALTHDMAPATCTEPSKCKREGCDYTEGEALGHSFTNYVSNGDAKCGVDGTETAKCDRCDVTDTRKDEGSALTHEYTNYVTSKEATCTENEEVTGTCKHGCGTTDTKVVEDSALGHEWAEATCTELSKCERCGETTGELKEHNIVNGKCTVCGLGDKTVAYVPLDQRPVNLDRVEYLAGSADFEVRTPAFDDIATIMDTNVAAGNGTKAQGGNPVNILAWLKQQEAEGVNNYVISLDQALSGGLAESRRQTGYHSASDWAATNTTFEGSAEQAMINYIAELASDPQNKVVLVETVMRLAPETDYKNFDNHMYEAFRQYGEIQRQEFSADSMTIGQATINKIYDAYSKDANGNVLGTSYNATYNNTTKTIDVAANSGYTSADFFNARKRKLELITALVQTEGIDGIKHLFIGVDDSSSAHNVQTNDRTYYTKLLEGKSYSYDLFGGADELGMLGMARLSADYYGYDDNANKIDANVTYFGEGYTGQADHYDFETLQQNVDKHLAALNINKVAREDVNTLQILVLARATTDIESEATDALAHALIDKLRANIKAGIPTCVIDASNNWSNNKRIFSDALFWDFEGRASGAEGPFDLANALSISCWNTVGNTVGIGLSNAVGRYAYLTKTDEVTEDSNQAFVQGFTFALVKDMAYRAHTSGNVTDANGNLVDGEFLTKHNSFPFDGLGNGENEWDTANRILQKLNKRNTILGKKDENGFGKVLFNRVTIDPNSVVWTWDRDFECNFDVVVGNTSDAIVDSNFTEATIPLNYINPAYNTTYANTYTNSIYVFASDDYISVPDYSGTTEAGYQWCYKALLEYDDVAGRYRVVATDANGSTYYANWHVGVDRIVIVSHANNKSSLIPNLKVNEYLELTGTTHEALKNLEDYALTDVKLTKVMNYQAAEITAPEVFAPVLKAPSAANKLTVAYVPLDDRPVHTDRVVLTAEEAGIEILMPDEEDYKTYLANETTGEKGHGGNTANILAWLEEQEASGIDYYVIALDQVFSGGLVNSRYSDSSFDGQLSAQDLKTANFLVDLAKDNYVVYTDTIMRLAATYPYKDHDANTYTALRAYGHYNRLPLEEGKVGSIATLDLEHVISGYRYGDNGVYGLYRGGTIDGASGSVEDDIIKGYLGARERKLRITDYMLRNAGANINHYYIGMDDSSSGENIQANEKRYLDMIIKKTGSNAIIFAGADEMSVMGISAMTNLYVKEDATKIPAADGWTATKVPVNVVYFGDASWQADAYDNGSLGTAIDLHLKSLDAYQVADTHKLAPGVIQLVVVGRGTSQVHFGEADIADPSGAIAQVAGSKANAIAAADYIDEQLEENRPVAIIDVSYWNAIHLNFVVEAMRNKGIFDRPDFNEILGYSTWNTAGNAIGLAMGQAFARYNYIMNAETITKDANLGFLKLLAYSFVKDSAYRTNSILNTWTMNTSSSKAISCGSVIYTTAGFTGNEFLGYINNSTEMLLGGCVSSEYDYNHNVSIHTPEWPVNWGPRNFECWFTAEATSDEPTERGSGDGIILPDEELN